MMMHCFSISIVDCVSHHQERGQDGGREEGVRRRRAVEGAVGALVGPAHLADAQDVEGGRVEGPDLRVRKRFSPLISRTQTKEPVCCRP